VRYQRLATGGVIGDNVGMSTPWSNLASTIRLLASGFTQLIYPTTCWSCGALTPSEPGPVCSVCLPLLTKDPFSTCPRCSSTVGPHVVLDQGCNFCQAESFAFDGAFRMAPYEGALRDVILRMKNWSGEELAQVMAGLWSRQMTPRLAGIAPDLVAPIPLHWMRRWRRGFNSSEILALGLATQLRIPCHARLLRRTRRTPRQTVQPSATARKENVKDAFVARDPSLVRDKTILLVDDVLTTGATLHEAARALRRCKPKAIYGVVLAHGR
jgi:ComF family protein